MDKNSQSAIIYVTKLEAARRQINAAIRMRLTKIDDLATHTVAAAAYRLLRELLDTRGVDDRDDVIRAGLISLAKQLASGTLSDNASKFLMDNEYMRPILSRIAGAITERGGDVDMDDIDSIIPRSAIKTSPSGKRSQLEQLWKASNFLKHADRNPHGAIALDDVDNDMMIISASAAYTMVAHDLTGPMAVFYTLASVTSPEKFEVDDGILKEIAKVLVPLSASRRRRTCLRIIKNWDKSFAGT